MARFSFYNCLSCASDIRCHYRSPSCHVLEY